ncbi:MAG: MFS transporter [Enterobacteriaceae bacterium]
MRILQGIGGALMVPVGRLAVLRTTPKHQLIKAIATLTWPALVAPIIGPPLGGFITRYASWHWIFFINVPLGLIAIALSLRIIPNIREDEQRPSTFPALLPPRWRWLAWSPPWSCSAIASLWAGRRWRCWRWAWAACSSRCGTSAAPGGRWCALMRSRSPPSGSPCTAVPCSAPPLAPCRFCCRCFSRSDLVWTPSTQGCWCWPCSSAT